MSAQKALQREVLGGTEGNIGSPTRGNKRSELFRKCTNFDMSVRGN